MNDCNIDIMSFNYMIILIWLGLYSQVVSGQCIYTGKVINTTTSEPLVGVTISAGSEAFATTDLRGEFYFEKPCGDIDFEFSYVGFEKKQISDLAHTNVIKMDPSPLFLNPLIVSASRYEQDRSAAPVAISTISTSMLSETKATRLDQVLNKVEGVYMVDLGNEQHTMAIRQPINYKGLFLYLEDGIPIRPTGVFNHNALLEINMAGLSRIEVIRGPASSLYGSEAIGGAINFITLRPAAFPAGRLSIQGNNNGYKRADFNASTTFGKLGIGAYGYYAKRSHGIREHSDFDKLALSFKASYIFDDRNTLGFDVTKIDYYADMTGALDSAFFFSKNFSSQHTFTNRAVESLRAKLSYNHFWKDQNKTTLTFFARDNSIRQNPSYRVRDDYSRWNNPGGDKHLAHGEVNENRVHSFGLVAQHNQAIDLLQGSNLSMGINFDISPNYFKANYISIHKSDENKYTSFTGTDSVLTDYRVLLMNAGLYLNWNVELTEHLSLSAALRYDQLNFDFENNLDENAFSGAPDDVDNFSALTPKLGLTYNFSAGNGIYTNYSQGFLPPQVSELYRGVKIPVLEPSIYNSYEVGGYFQWQNRIGFDISLYQMNGKNEIINVLLDDGTRVNRNAGATVHRGVEYGVKWKISRDLSLRVSGTNASHLFREYVESGEDYSNNEMANAPSWIANSELAYKPSWFKDFRASIEWQHIDEYFMGNGNTLTYPGYDIFNLRLSYSVRDFEIWTNIMNVSDELYATIASSSQWGESYTAGEARTINVGIAYNFHSKKDKKTNYETK